MSDPLSEFLRRHAPEPPPARVDLEERILAALRSTPTRRVEGRWLVACSLLILLLGGLGLWQQRPGPTLPGYPSVIWSVVETDISLFAIDPRTELYALDY